MFKKKKTKKTQLEECLEEFNKYIHSEDKTKEYMGLSEVYTQIKECYTEKIKNNQIDIKIEKIQLEKRLGRYNGAASNYDIMLFISIIAAMFSLYFNVYFNAVKVWNFKENIWVSTIFLVVLTLIIIKAFSKDIDKDKPKDIMYHISLKVLKDIEEEQIKKEKMENIKQYIDKRNILESFIKLAIGEVAATKLIKDGVVKKLFNRYLKR
ncbi:hypothetical protein [Clostridium ganghwense]|uniref:SMODS and SLOG-associating 2TM effector domain-containing protein n=1 Tax=Clostridium ganghwense TaxID=312089 RepID=A0ABT4CRC0_9CLOT|nr:hypothetical protein [Clostridium ganghwense]MCY6370766.1 hypothetical protein [Clostridium ganghwense]